jgi:hypothetical protein
MQTANKYKEGHHQSEGVDFVLLMTGAYYAFSYKNIRLGFTVWELLSWKWDRK